ncbi:MAG: glycosyltransferase family 4 protein [Anaerolineae bacterium]
MKVGVNATFLRHPHTGTGAYLGQLLATLPEAAPHLEVVLYAPDGAPLPGGLPYPVRLLPTPARLGDNWAKLAFEQFAFPHAALADGCDVLHVPHFAPPFLAGERAVVTVHDLIPLMLRQYASGPAARAYAMLVAATARRAACLLADSKCTARDIVQRLRVPASRVAVVYLAAGPHCHPVSDPAAIERVRQRYALPRQYVLYFGGYDCRKEVSTLLGAYQRLIGSMADAPPLVLAGRLPDADTAALRDPRPLIERLGLTGRVVAGGAFDEADKPAMLSAARCFVFPSLYEGFGLPPLEAMACGAPVVATRSGSVPEVCGDAAILVPPESPAGLAEAMARLLGDDGLGQWLRQKGLVRAARFTWQDAVERTVRAYERTGVKTR